MQHTLVGSSRRMAAPFRTNSPIKLRYRCDSWAMNQTSKQGLIPKKSHCRKKNPPTTISFCETFFFRVLSSPILCSPSWGTASGLFSTSKPSSRPWIRRASCFSRNDIENLIRIPLTPVGKQFEVSCASGFRNLPGSFVPNDQIGEC
jgi:hypothetical protein